MDDTSRPLAEIVADEVRVRAVVPTTVVAITGPVCVGKTTLASNLRGSLGGAIAVVGTDAFLFPTAELVARGLVMRKGFPETFDTHALTAFLGAVREGSVAYAPVYSHVTYDVTDDRVAVEQPDVLVVEGLHLATPEFGVSHQLDLSVYLDAPDEVLEAWYVERFAQHVADAHAAGEQGFAYYRSLDPDDCDDAARWVWREVNLPNAHAQRTPGRAHADVVVDLSADRTVRELVNRT